jgi:hypothetical protein
MLLMTARYPPFGAAIKAVATIDSGVQNGVDLRSQD